LLPVQLTAAPPGRITLEFGLGPLFFFSNEVARLPNEKNWQKVIDSFTSADPQVENINLHISNYSDLKSNAESYDCFYLSTNPLPSTFDLENSGLLNLDSFNKTKDALHEKNFIGTSLSQMKYSGKLWGLPTTLSPVVIAYAVDLFGNHNSIFGLPDVPLPPIALNVSRFEKLLKDIKLLVPDASDSYLLILMAAYGGLPLDYRTTPPKVNFTDAATVKVIKKVLDFSKIDKTMWYFQLYYEQGGGGGDVSDMAAYIIQFDGLSTFPGLYNNGLGNLPTGQFSTVSYDVGAMYISAKTAYPEACYRWMNTVSKHPELFTGMPAQTSMLDNSRLLASQGARAVSFYKLYSRIANQSATIYIPLRGSLVVDFPFRQWLDESFDAYVLRNETLEVALQKAQDYAVQYQACLTASSFDLANRQEAHQKTQACLKKVDPRKVDH
jgi:ABC-type glycerol-3-phosphate transport system substrate-binding protein